MNRCIALLLMGGLWGPPAVCQSGSASSPAAKDGLGKVVEAPGRASSASASSLTEADELLREGKYKAAGELYAAAVKKTPPNPAAYAGLARTYLKQEDVTAAHEAAQKGIEAVPGSSAMHCSLGEVFFREGKIPEAEAEFAKAQQLDASNARAWYGRARVYRSISMYKHMRDYLVKAHELDPQDREIQSAWIATRSPSERITELEKFLAAPPTEDTNVRERAQRRLEALKQRQSQPTRSCKLARPLPQTETSLDPLMTDPKHIRGWGLRVNINGNTSHLLIDTGASGIVINRRAAEKAGVTKAMETKLWGLGDKGPMNGYVGYADSIKIGDLEFQNCLVAVSDQRSITDEDGLIGSDVFAAYLITLDFPDHKLRLSPLPKSPEETSAEVPQLKTEGDSEGEGEKTASGQEETIKPKGPQDRYIAPEMQSYTRIFRFGHDLLIPTKVGEASPKLFLIDTGSFGNLMSPETAREVTKVYSDAYSRVKGISGRVNEVSRADEATLQFGHFRQQNQNIVTIDLSHISRSAGTEVSGILGFSTLRFMQVKIDYRDGLVDFFYDPNRLH